MGQGLILFRIAKKGGYLKTASSEKRQIISREIISGGLKENEGRPHFPPFSHGRRRVKLRVSDS